MGDYSAYAAAAAQLVGGYMKGKGEKDAAKASDATQLRLAKMGIDAAKDMEREKFQRERELWQKAMGAYSGFSQAPSLRGLSQMNTPYTQYNTVDQQPENPNATGR